LQSEHSNSEIRGYQQRIRSGVGV